MQRRRRAVITASDSESEVEVVPAAVQPLRWARPQERAQPSMSMESDGLLDQLLGMGFSLGPAKRALEIAGGDLNAAAEICLENNSAVADPAVPSAPSGAVASRQQSHAAMVEKPAERQKTRVLAHFPQQLPLRSATKASKRQVPQAVLQQQNGQHKRRRIDASSEDNVSDWHSSDEDNSSDTADDADAAASKGFEMSDSGDSSCSERRRRSGTRALREVSGMAQTVLLDALTGPKNPEESEAAFRRRRVDVRQTISQGCTKLRTHFWLSSDNLIAKSACFKLMKAHQCVGVRWLLGLHAVAPGMILADEMGLGKTLQTLCFLEILASTKPSLIVAPASLLQTWESEAAKWTPRLRTLKYHASNQGERVDIAQEFLRNPKRYELVITTPNVFNCKLDRDVFFRRIEFEYLICDEAHGLKNSSTHRYREITRTVKSSRRLLLTGTPVQNSLAELATLLGFALSAEKGKQVSAELKEISEEPHEKALRQLQAAAAPLILRRLKADVLSELPAKRGVVIYCEMDGLQRQLYDKEMVTCRKSGTFTQANVKEAFCQLRRICLHPLMGKHRLSKEQNAKLVEELCGVRPDFAKAGFARAAKEVATWSDFDKHEMAVAYGLSHEFRVSKKELLSSAKMVSLLHILKEKSPTEGKTLVFSQFTQLLDVVQAALTASGIGFCRLDGKTAIQDRHGIVANFQAEGGPHVFLISTKAGGVGLNLTAASTVVMLDLDFNPQNSRQAEDRVHRLGQNREVTVYYLICRDTVEDMVLQRNVDKMQLDRQFGARRTALESAVEEATALGSCKHTEIHNEGEGVAAEAHAKNCEKQVMKQLQQLLKKTRHEDSVSSF